MRYSIYFIITWLTISVLYNAEAQIIQGLVVDESDNQPLIGAHVMVRDNWRIGSVTDINGHFLFSIPDTLSSPVQIIITFIGYKEKVIGVFSNNEDPVEIRMKPSANEIEAVVISDNPLFAEQFSVREISRLEVYKNPSAKADVLLAVNSLPSSTTLDESANISFRGSSPAQTGIFLNGVPIYDAVRFSQINGIGTFSIFNTSIINEINVFPANPPLEYGNTSSGLIAVDTRTRHPEVNTTSAIISMANYGIETSRRVGENLSFTLYTNFQPSTLIKSVNSEALKNINSFNSYDFGVHSVYTGSEGGVIKVFNYTLLEGYNVKYRHSSYIGKFIQKRNRNMTVATYYRPMGRGIFTWNSGYSFSRIGFSFSQFDYRIGKENIYSGISYQLEGERAGMKLGFAYDQEQESFRGLVPVFDYALGEQNPSFPVRQTSLRVVAEPFLSINYHPWKSLTINHSMRTNIPVYKSPTYLSYQTSLAVALKDDHSIKLSGGAYNQLDQTTFNSDLIHYNTQQVSVDHQYRGSRIESTNSLFAKKSDNGQILDKIFGIETAWKWKAKRGSFFEIAYTGLNVNSTNGEVALRSPYDLNYFIRVSSEWALRSNWTIGTRGLFRQGTFFRPLQSASFNPELNVYQPIFADQGFERRFPAYQILDISLSKLLSISEHVLIILFANVSNIFDARNVRDYSYNEDYTRRIPELFSRRAVYFGVQLNFQ